MADEKAEQTVVSRAQADAVMPGAAGVDALLAGGAMDATMGSARDDELLARDSADAMLSDMDMEATLAPAPGDAPLDAVLLQSTTTVTQTTIAPAAAQQSAEVSDALLAALLNAAESPAPKAEVSVENLAAAATAPQVAEEQAATGGRAKFERKLAGDPAAAAIGLAEAAEASAEHQDISNMGAGGQPVRRVRREWNPPQLVSPWMRANGARFAASIMAGALGGAVTLAMLMASNEQRPTMAQLSTTRALDMESALERAREFAAEGDYHEAAALLLPAMKGAPDSEARADAEFLVAQARVKTMEAPPGSDAYSDLQEQIGRLIEAHPQHPMAAQAREWQAELFEAQELPAAAYDVMKRAVKDFPEAKEGDELLLHTAQLGLELNRVQEAAEFLQSLLDKYPGSHHLGEAELLLGEAYLRTGMEEDAREMFSRVAREDPNPETRAKGIVHLGHMAMKSGDYPGAQAQFQQYLAESAGQPGNDAVALELAKAQRAQNQLTSARDTLNQLIKFFPQTSVTPQAYVELVEITDALGDRAEAFKLAQEASKQFPKDAQVLRAKGTMLGLLGRPKAAGETLVAAHDAGAFDPEVLLTAARHLRTAGMYDDAERIYRRLGNEYGGLPAAIEGGIELAKLDFARGDLREAVEGLQGLDVATAAAPQHAEVLKAQADIYEQLDWRDELAQACTKLAAASTEDEDIARAAMGLLTAGQVPEAKKLYDRLSLERLREQTAHALLWRMGEAVLPTAPQEGMALMEQAYAANPQLRTAEEATTLLRAYIAADRPAAARRVVMDMAVAAKEQPAENLPLVEAAIAWGDFLYGKGDFRTAADAYAMAEDAAKQLGAPPSAPGVDPRWAQYQRANALLQLADYQGGLRLLDEIAATDAPWAREAEAKAHFTRMEQRLSSAG